MTRKDKKEKMKKKQDTSCYRGVDNWGTGSLVSKEKKSGGTVCHSHISFIVCNCHRPLSLFLENRVIEKTALYQYLPQVERDYFCIENSRVLVENLVSAKHQILYYSITSGA